MLLTLALVVLLSAIAVFFSEEFIKTFKRIFAIKGTKLIIPLFAASWCIYTFNVMFLWGIYYVHEFLLIVFNFLVSIIPFKKGAVSLVLIFMLTFLSVMPIFLLHVLTQRRKYIRYKPYLFSGIIWIISVFLLIVV